jgi:hypothetical protein
VTVIDPARLVEMANQIGDFFAPYPEQRRWLVEVAREWDVHGAHIERAAGGDAMVAEPRLTIW